MRGDGEICSVAAGGICEKQPLALLVLRRTRGGVTLLQTTHPALKYKRTYADGWDGNGLSNLKINICWTSFMCKNIDENVLVCQ